ncbi:MAG: transposase [Stellaceae bacterium]
MRIDHMTLAELERAFPDDDACRAHLVTHRWPRGVRCPRCNSKSVYRHNSRRWHWECPDCSRGGAYRFSSTVGTIFKNSKLPLRSWFRVVHMMTNPNGVRVMNVYREMSFGSYKAAWRMYYQLRRDLRKRRFLTIMGMIRPGETSPR